MQEASSQARAATRAGRRRLLSSDLPYGPRMTRLLPGLHRALGTANRYLAVPLLRSGLGPLLSTPITGSLMVLRTRGRRSGLWRDAPLGYVLHHGCVYCCAGFGERTHWLQNILQHPDVEALLPGRAIAGTASLVTDPGEQAVVMRQLLLSMRLISRPMLGDPRAASDNDLCALADSLPLVRIQPTGVAAGPWDPGGRGWILASAVTGCLVARSAWRLVRSRRRSRR